MSRMECRNCWFTGDDVQDFVSTNTPGERYCPQCRTDQCYLIEPQCCPFCKSTNVRQEVEHWIAKLIPQNSDTSQDGTYLDEHQCLECARSFWT